jgi:hypothetical protein
MLEYRALFTLSRNATAKCSSRTAFLTYALSLFVVSAGVRHFLVITILIKTGMVPNWCTSTVLDGIHSILEQFQIGLCWHVFALMATVDSLCRFVQGLR